MNSREDLIDSENGGHVRAEDDIERIESVLDEIDDQSRHEDDKERISIYLRIFEEMINIVHEYEYHLLCEEEWDVVCKFGQLNYNARFVLVRLALRKPGQWYSVPKLLSLKKEVGEGLSDAIDELCVSATKFSSEANDDDFKVNVKQETVTEDNIIDLTLDSDNDPVDTVPSQPTASISSQSATPDYSYFCQSVEVMTLPELLNCLTVDQLRSIAKDMKVHLNKQVKSEMISTLLRHASRQSTLNFSPSPKKTKAAGSSLRQSTLGFPILSQSRTKPLRQTTLPFSKQCGGKDKSKEFMLSQENVLRNLALKHLIKCVRLNPAIFELFMRINIIAFRSTEMPKSIALPALLTAFKKRSYTKYAFQRDSAIWSTREEFLKYDEALRTQARIDSLLDLQSNTPTSSALALDGSSSSMATPGRQSATPTMSPLGRSAPHRSAPNVKDDDNDSDYEEHVPEDSPRQQRAKLVKKVFDEEIYPMWKVLLTVRRTKDDPEARRAGLERFDPGYVYTGMVSRATEALGLLKQYQLEYSVIEALLEQKVWLRGKRAKWYERRAILMARYMWQDRNDLSKRDALTNAMNGVIAALEDEDTALVYRPSLFRRLERLEKQLRIPETNRSRCDGQLRKPAVVHIEGIRVWTRTGKLGFDANGRIIPQCDAKKKNYKENADAVMTPARKIQPPFRKSQTPTSRIQTPVCKEQLTLFQTPWSGGTKAVEVQSPSCSETSPKKAKEVEVKWTGKSVWLGKGAEEVNVETRALQYYERQGFKGFHSETSILTTLFSLLFWDIIFENVPGAFETPYQTEPLDLRDDIFYYARKGSIDVRLKEIRAGWAKAIIEKHDQQYREKKTWCVGVSWDLCERSDLIEIAECLGGEALAIICRLFCEDYNGRSSGVPDLIIWNPKELQCKFVEVKGPGDTERENQKLWMDALLGAGIAVEVCKVHEAGNMPGAKGKGKGKATHKATPKRTPLRGGKAKKVKAKSKPSDTQIASKDGGSCNVPTMIDVDGWELAVEAKDGNFATTSSADATGWDDDDDELPVHADCTPTSATPVSPRKRIFDLVEVVITSPKRPRFS